MSLQLHQTLQFRCLYHNKATPLLIDRYGLTVSAHDEREHPSGALNEVILEQVVHVILGLQTQIGKMYGHWQQQDELKAASSCAGYCQAAEDIVMIGVMHI